MSLVCEKPWKALTVFITVAYGAAFLLDYAAILPLYNNATSLLARLALLGLLVARMWLPGLGALASLRLCGQGPRRYLREAINEPSISSLVLAALLVLASYSTALPIGVLLGLHVSPCIGIGPVIIALLIVVGVVAGLTINAIVALGEEIAWRGVLLDVLKERYGVWPASLVIGVVWGAWHAPLIMHGYDFSNPLPGSCGPIVNGVEALLVFTAFTTALSVLLVLARELSGSLLAAAVGHGTVNAVAGLYAILVKGPRTLAPPAGITVALGMLIVVLGAQFLASGSGAESREAKRPCSSIGARC